MSGGGPLVACVVRTGIGQCYVGYILPKANLNPPVREFLEKSMENIAVDNVACAAHGQVPAEATPGAKEHLSKSNEDYIESIYRIMRAEGGEKGVRSVDVAEQLDVSKASVNKAVTTLRNAGYVEQNRYGRIQLTDSGVSYARRVWRCHRMLRSFLERDLGVDPKTADAEACLMEHALSPDTQDKWLAYLEKQGIQVEE